MKKILFSLTLLIAIFGVGQLTVFAQNGGKAEANRVKVAKGKLNAVVTGNIKVSEQAEYIFSAKRGQKVKLNIITTKPKGKLAQFSLKGDNVEFSTEFDSYKEYEFTAPETGDYFFAVMFAAAGNYRSAAYALTLTIKN